MEEKRMYVYALGTKFLVSQQWDNYTNQSITLVSDPVTHASLFLHFKDIPDNEQDMSERFTPEAFRVILERCCHYLASSGVNCKVIEISPLLDSDTISSGWCKYDTWKHLLVKIEQKI